MARARTDSALWLVPVALRILAVVVLVAGPWFDEPEELTGWDANRFQQIHDADGRPWVDHAVEYPPGSVALIELIARGDVVGTHRTLVVASLLVDLTVAWLLHRRLGRRASLMYLWLGTLMLPAGLLRFDTWAAGCTAVALLALSPETERTSLRSREVLTFAGATVIGAAIKIAPALLLPVAVALSLRRRTLATSALAAFAVTAWLAYAGVDAVEQVTSLRGATGWHVESVPGSLIALFTGDAPRFEADAYRIGTLQPSLVLAGRLAVLAVLGFLGIRAHTLGPSRPTARDLRTCGSLVLLGGTATLIVTAPLLSPQFVLWLVPIAVIADDGMTAAATPLTWRDVPATTWLTAAVLALTALPLHLHGPPGADHPVAASLLLLRDAGLVLLVLAAGRAVVSYVGGDTPAGDRPGAAAGRPPHPGGG